MLEDVQQTPLQSLTGEELFNEGYQRQSVGLYSCFWAIVVPCPSHRSHFILYYINFVNYMEDSYSSETAVLRVVFPGDGWSLKYKVFVGDQHL